MTREDKELLLKDLCSRVPYGVKCKYNDGVIVNILSVNFFYAQIEGWEKYVNHTLKYDVEDIKPYLFPMSSMTHEQRKELIEYAGYERREKDVGCHSETYYYDLVGHENILYPDSDAIDWLNENHFDYRGLIEKGLAIDATGLNIY
jgi:hypothetical protein